MRSISENIANETIFDIAQLHTHQETPTFPHHRSTMTTEATANREIEAPRKRMTTAGRLRAKFEALIDRDEALMAEHQVKMSSLQNRINAWQEAISEINAEPAE
jgi:hypothetical protein